MARGAALRASARPLPGRARPPDGLALHLRRRLPRRARPAADAALSDLYHLRDLCRPRALRHDPTLQRHAVLAQHGLRPRDRRHAPAARQPLSALVPAVRQARRIGGGVAVPGLCIPADRMGLARRAAGMGVPGRAAGAGALGAAARRHRPLPVLGHQAAGELRRRDELRHLPDVLRVLGALSAVADRRGQRAAARHRALQPVHALRRADPLRALFAGQLDLAGRGRRLHGAVPGRGDRRLRPDTRPARPPRAHARELPIAGSRGPGCARPRGLRCRRLPGRSTAPRSGPRRRTAPPRHPRRSGRRRPASPSRGRHP